jgi:hypothetical protein
MSLIYCTCDCIYQSDGICSLQRVPSAAEKYCGSDTCMHCVKSNKSDNFNLKQSLWHRKEFLP